MSAANAARSMIQRTTLHSAAPITGSTTTAQKITTGALNMILAILFLCIAAGTIIGRALTRAIA